MIYFCLKAHGLIVNTFLIRSNLKTIVFKLNQFPHLSETFILSQIITAINSGYNVSTTSATHGTRPLRSTLCRRDRASTTTRVPTDPYHSRKMTTRRYDFRHQPSAGCTYSSSAVLRATSRGVS